MDHKSKNCPLCDGPVRYYYLNFTELLLMCGIIYCDYPFGYEELKIITKEQWINENNENPPVEKIKKEYESDKLSKANLLLALECGRIYRLIKKLENKTQRNYKHVERNLLKIKKLNDKINLLKYKEKIIKNDEMVKNGGACEAHPADNFEMNTKLTN